MARSEYITDTISIGPTTSGATLTNISSYLDSYNVEIEDIDAGSTRTTDGTYIKNRIAQKRHITLTFRPLTPAESNIVMTILLNKYVAVEYIDPVISTSPTTTNSITAYVSRKDSNFHAVKGNTSTSIIASGTGVGFWEGFSVELIEV